MWSSVTERKYRFSMNVIQANKYYYERGGADRYALDLARLLEAHGHTVIPFAMQHPMNHATGWSKFFPSQVQTERSQISFSGAKTVGRMLYSWEAKSKMRKLIKASNPNLCHLHNIYTQLSPSILAPLKHKRIPTVMTVHDYHLVAPNYMLFSRGRIEDWGRTGVIRSALARYHKDSFTASLAQSFTFKFHQWLRIYERSVDKFIVPSDCVRSIMIEAGFPESKIVTVPFYLDLNRIESKKPEDDQGYFLFVGRIVPEKGLETLVRALEELPDIKLKVLGSGPDEVRMKELARGAGNIEWLGWRSGEPAWDLYRGARAVIVPSIWYEVFGLVAMEAMATGTAVIASDIGGLPEVVDDRVTGRVFPPGDVSELRTHIQELARDRELAFAYGAAGRSKVQKQYNPDVHYDRVMEVYKSVL